MTEDRIANIKITVVGVVDAAGELHARAVDDTCDTVCIWAATDLDGLDDPAYFESEAYHLPVWCDEYGFEYFEGEFETEVILEGK